MPYHHHITFELVECGATTQIVYSESHMAIS